MRMSPRQVSNQKALIRAQRVCKGYSNMWLILSSERTWTCYNHVHNSIVKFPTRPDHQTGKFLIINTKYFHPFKNYQNSLLIRIVKYPILLFKIFNLKLHHPYPRIGFPGKLPLVSACINRVPKFLKTVTRSPSFVSSV